MAISGGSTEYSKILTHDKTTYELYAEKINIDSFSIKKTAAIENVDYCSLRPPVNNLSKRWKQM
jgi:hypothetical protein